MLEFFKLFFNLNYYQELLAGSGKKVFKAFLVISIIINLVFGIIFSNHLKQSWLIALQQTHDQIIAEYPKDLVLSWNGTELNFYPNNQPLNIYWPKAFSEAKLPGILAKFAPETQSPDQISSNSINQTPLFWLNRTQIWVSNLTNNSWSKAQPLQEIFKSFKIDQGQINQQNLAGYMDIFQVKFSQFIQVGIIFLPGLITLGYIISGIIFAATEASFIWFFGNLLRWKTSWRQIFKLSLLIVPIAQTMELISNQLYPAYDWSFFHITYWLIFVLIGLTSPALLNYRQPSTQVN